MNKKYTILMVIALLGALFNPVAGQEQAGLRERARQQYYQYHYYQAAQLFERVVQVKKPFLQDMEMLADTYRRLKNYEKAEYWYSRVVAMPKHQADDLLNYGEMLKSNEKYEQAKEIFRQYAGTKGNQARVPALIAGCDSALVWKAKPTAYTLKNQEAVNTNRSEFSVFPLFGKAYFAAEPDTALFKSIYGRTGNPYLRIFTAEDKQQELTDPQLDRSGYNSGKFHIGPLSANSAGTTLYVSRTTETNAEEVDVINKIKYTKNNLELYIYQKEGTEWKESAFAYNNVKKYSVGHAALSKDEKVLYFVSDMPGGYGGTDIWYCELQADGTWATPQNAGPQINTAGDEMFPYITGDKLYFSSNGWPGMGGLDIFETKGDRQNWSTAINMQYPLNSGGDDFGFAVESDGDEWYKGFLSSNRKGGKGGDDIYSYSFKKPSAKIILAVKGKVTDSKSGKVIPDAQVALSGGSKPLTAGSIFFFELEKDKDYTLTAKKEKFDTDIKTFSTKGLKKSDTLVLDLKIETLFEIGKVFTLRNINYDFDKDNIRKDAAVILDSLVQVMRDNPTLEIELGSHTDSRGKDSYNLALSQRRAQSVVNYLVSKGISRSRMVAKGYGETQLLNGCDDGVPCTEEQHQANRRTVFKVLKY